MIHLKGKVELSIKTGLFALYCTWILSFVNNFVQISSSVTMDSFMHEWERRNIILNVYIEKLTCRFWYLLKCSEYFSRYSLHLVNTQQSLLFHNQAANSLIFITVWEKEIISL